MRVIGVTGSVATGKTTVAGMFGRLGARVVDADAIVHDLLQNDPECVNQVVRAFGADLLTPAGGVDRPRLAALVFGDRQRLKTLEAILHPQVIRRVQTAIHAAQGQTGVKAVVLDVPLLFEAGLNVLTDLNIAVQARPQDQLIRGARKGWPEEDLRARIAAQLSPREKARRADLVIDNSQQEEETERQVRTIWTEYIDPGPTKI